MTNRTIFALTVLLLPFGHLLAARTDPCQSSPSTSDVRFELAPKDGRTTFREGEIIPLVLSFSSAAKDRYAAEVRNYDRSGRMDIEAYCVEPQAPDPIAGFLGGFGGGGGNDTKIGTSPLIAEAELNEWLRLAPGHYRVFAVSRRGWRRDAVPQTPNTRVSEVLRSNTVDLDVTAADTDWQRDQLHNAVQALASAATPEDRRHAIRVIRFLNTEDSTRQLAHLFWDLNQQPYGWDLMFGLAGSPFRKLAIDSMEAEITVPDHAITDDYLNTLVRLEVNSQEPAATTAANTAILMKAAVDRIVAALPNKVGGARAQTLTGLLISGGTDPAMARTFRSALIAEWADLPVDTQRDLILNRWQLIAGPDMLPVLRRIVDEPPTPNRTVIAMTREAALKHILELDPAEGRALTLGEVMNRNAFPTLATIKTLPPDDLRAIVDVAVKRVGEGTARELDLELLDHYGDARALESAKQLFERSGSMKDCTPYLLRYFLRVDPAYGAQQIAVSLGQRKENACYKYLLQSLGDLLPKAEDSAVRALDDPDPDLVIDALVALRLWGSAAAEPALWARLKRFHEEWAGQADQFRLVGDPGSEGSHGFSLEQSLAGAIAAGAGWICPPDKLALLSELVGSAAQKRQIESWAQQWSQSPATITPNWSPDGSLSFSVLQYVLRNEEQLAAKIGQLPAGMRLIWKFQDFGQFSPPVTMAMQDAAYERLRAVAEKHGVTLGKAGKP